MYSGAPFLLSCGDSAALYQFGCLFYNFVGRTKPTLMTLSIQHIAQPSRVGPLLESQRFVSKCDGFICPFQEDASFRSIFSCLISPGDMLSTSHVNHMLKLHVCCRLTADTGCGSYCLSDGEYHGLTALWSRTRLMLLTT